MSKLKIFVAWLALAVVPAAPAFAGTIVDFEDVVVDGASYTSSEIISNGFIFKQTATADLMGVMRDPVAECGPPCVAHPSQYFYIYNPDQTGPFESTITQQSGISFTLKSFELATMFPFVPDPTSMVTVRGVKSSGEIVTQEVDYDDIPDNFQPVSLGSELSDLTSVTLTSNFVFPAADNFSFFVATKSVPGLGMPGIILMGLLLLVTARRRLIALLQSV